MIKSQNCCQNFFESLSDYERQVGVRVSEVWVFGDIVFGVYFSY